MGYRFLRFPEGKTKVFTMSYDDGCAEDIKMSKLITEYGIKCTFNFNVFQNFTVDDAKKHILGNGHEIAVHGAKHQAPGLVRSIEGIKDILDCRINLENKYGTIIRGMAYPDSGITKFLNQSSYDDIKKYLLDLDIAYSRTLGGDNNSFLLPNDWHAWIPTAHHTNPDVMDYLDEFLNIDPTDIYCAWRYSRIFYLWGHSFEYERDNSWELLNKICKKVSQNKEIWCATNIEIYEYVNAYNSLIFSADSKIIYNPTLIEIWFEVDEKLYFIKPGETLHLY